jgi:hypothetical protein
MRKTLYFTVIFDAEADGAISAYVAGLPVYAQALTQDAAGQAIHDTLDAYLEEHPDAVPTTVTKVARVSATANRRSVEIMTTAALVGARTSRAKRRSSRANGKLGGRPKKSAHAN